MKSFSNILVLLSLAISVSAAAPELRSLSRQSIEGSRCERLEYYDMDHLQASFERDLLSNVWHTNLLGSMSDLYFQEDGLVIAIPVGSATVESYMWSLVVDEGQASLSLLSPTIEKVFIISPTCNGISAASHGKSSPMLIGAEEMLSHAQLEFMRLQLAGTWHYEASKSRKANPARFSIALKADGTFNLETAPDGCHSPQQGVWHLSEDGQYLMLYTEMYVGQEKKYVAESIRLKSVDFEDMVIDASLLPRVLQQYRGKQMLYLGKAQA